MGKYSRALNPIERISIFLDQRRKKGYPRTFVLALQKMASSDIEELGYRFVGNVAQHSSKTPAPASAPAPAPAPACGLALLQLCRGYPQ